MPSLTDNDIDVIGKKMTIVGAGGAATAIEIQAALDGVGEIVIFNRRMSSGTVPYLLLKRSTQEHPATQFSMISPTLTS